MVWDSNLVEQAMQLANAAVDLLRQVASVHDGGDVNQCLAEYGQCKRESLSDLRLVGFSVAA
jgi:hypothetical protein